MGEAEVSGGYGAKLVPLLLASWKDRLGGRSARANARWGWIRRPAGEGRKVIWFRAGGDPDSVRLGVELLGAVRQKRLDARLALTFEWDYPEILEERVRGMRQIGLGYGPADRPAVVRRVLKRLDPAGVVVVGTSIPPHLLQGLRERGIPMIAFNTPPDSDPWGIEAVFPTTPSERERWKATGFAGGLGFAADPMALFALSQSDTTLVALVSQNSEETLSVWWWHGCDPARAQAFAEAWSQSSAAQAGVLFVSFAQGGRAPSPGRRWRGGLQAISQWRRSALPPGTVMFADDHHWLAAIASAASGIHVDCRDRVAFWQAMAGGSPLSLSPDAADERTQGGDTAPDVRAGSPTEILEHWTAWQMDPLSARQRGDAWRRRFWDERRGVQRSVDDFVNRVYEW